MTTATKKLTRKEYADKLAAAQKAFGEVKAQAGGGSASPAQVFTVPAEVKKEAQYKGRFGDFLHGVRKAYTPGMVMDEPLREWSHATVSKAASGLSEGAGGDGGFLVPPEFAAKLFERVYAEENLLAKTDQYTVTGNNMSFPRNNESSRADGSRWGGVQSYWMDEAGQFTGSRPGFGKLDLKLHKLGVFIYATDELMEDHSGIALEQYITKVGSAEINFKVGDSIINGTGAGKPLGILNSPCKVKVSKEVGQGAATILYENVVKMWARLFAPCWANAAWYINQNTLPQLLTMALAVGTGGLPAYLPPGGLSAAPYGTLLGKPVMPLEWCASVGTEGDIILADLSQMVTITKGAIDTAMSIHLRFDYGERVWRLYFRVDGAPWWASALTPYKGASDTQSCFVTLETR